MKTKFSVTVQTTLNKAVCPEIKHKIILGPGCSKLSMSLVKVLLKFQMLISEICQYFFVEKM